MASILIGFLKTRFRRDSRFFIICSTSFFLLKNLLFLFRSTLENVDFFWPQRSKIEGYNSQYGQDRVLEKYLNFKGYGFFIDIGANHPVNGSNSFFLEKNYGWSGICFDVIDFRKAYCEIRPNTQFICALLGEDFGERQFHFVEPRVKSDENAWFNKLSSVGISLSSLEGLDIEIKTRRVSQYPLKHFISSECHCDVMMLDAEGAELEILRSFDWCNSRSPKIILVENNGQYCDRDMIRRFLCVKGYSLCARIGWTDEIYRLNEL